jgi:hypothetical protein
LRTWIAKSGLVFSGSEATFTLHGFREFHKRGKLNLSLIMIIALLSGVVADDFEVSPNVVYDSSTVVGIMLGYEVGDYHMAPYNYLYEVPDR